MLLVFWTPVCLEPTLRAKFRKLKWKKKMYLQIYSFHHCLFLLKLVRILLVARVFVPICRKKIDQSAAGFSHYNRPGTWPHFLKPKSDFQVYLWKFCPLKEIPLIVFFHDQSWMGPQNNLHLSLFLMWTLSSPILINKPSLGFPFLHPLIKISPPCSDTTLDFPLNF